VNFSFFRDAHTAFEQPDFVWSVCEKTLGVSRMLLSEYLGRRRECDLITILDRGEIKLNRVVAIGGDRLTSGLAEALNISYVEAENIKIGMPTEVQPNLESILSPLGRELRASIDFFEHQNDKSVSQVYISGGSARSDLIMQALQAELMVGCKTWNPAAFLQLDPQKASELEQVTPQLTVALGAATSAF